MKRTMALLLAAVLLLSATAVTAFAETTEKQMDTEIVQLYEDVIPYWTKDSAVMESIVAFVAEATDESSENYVPEEDRIAVFDFDGTLFGELFPVYIDHCLLIHRALHDETYEPSEETKEYAQSMEDALNNPSSLPKGSANYIADVFKGMTIEEYRDYVRDFMSTPVWGFEGMTYGEAFYQPMVSLVQYLAEHDFAVYISSGSERNMIRELIDGTLDEWIPVERVIGSNFTLTTPGQGDTAARDYTYAPDDKVIFEGTPSTKNLKAGKVYGIAEEIGKVPVLVFGNSSGDLAMGQYAVQGGGKAYMLLCDDTERDYGNLSVAESFAADCEALGFETVSMKNDFATIYGDAVVKVEEADLEQAA